MTARRLPAMTVLTCKIFLFSCSRLQEIGVFLGRKPTHEVGGESVESGDCDTPVESGDSRLTYRYDSCRNRWTRRL